MQWSFKVSSEILFSPFKYFMFFGNLVVYLILLLKKKTETPLINWFYLICLTTFEKKNLGCVDSYKVFSSKWNPIELGSAHNRFYYLINQNHWSPKAIPSETFYFLNIWFCTVFDMVLKSTKQNKIKRNSTFLNQFYLPCVSLVGW